MEYEYSFKVKSHKPYIEYCEKNGYKLESDVKQQGFAFKAPNKTVARIKIDIPKDGSKPKKVLDFKDEDNSKTLVKERRESLALEFEDDKAVASILEFLGYEDDGSYIRRRRVYVKGDVKFEMDYYIKSRNKVMAIEGEKEAVDKVYQEIKDIELAYGELRF